MKPDVTLLDRFRDGAVREQLADREGPSMEISEHLSAELLSSYLLGTIAPGAALAVEAHIGLCEQCRYEAGLTEHPGASPGAAPELDKVHGGVGAPDDLSGGGVGPAALGRVTTGGWRRIARGVRSSRLGGVSGLGESVHLLAAEVGAPLSLPAAAHFLVVLEGAVRAGDRVHSQGDFIDTAGVRLKEASADGPSACLCLVVGDDDLYARPLIDLLKQLLAGVAKPRR